MPSDHLVCHGLQQKQSETGSIKFRARKTVPRPVADVTEWNRRLFSFNVKIVIKHINSKTLVQCRTELSPFASRLCPDSFALGFQKQNLSSSYTGFLSCCNTATYILKNLLCFEWDPWSTNICSVLVPMAVRLTAMDTPASSSGARNHRVGGPAEDKVGLFHSITLVLPVFSIYTVWTSGFNKWADEYIQVGLICHHCQYIDYTTHEVCHQVPWQCYMWN